MAPHWSQLEFHGSTHDSICRIDSKRSVESQNNPCRTPDPAGVGKCPNWTSPNYWGYNHQQILESDVQNPQNRTFTNPCPGDFFMAFPGRCFFQVTVHFTEDNQRWSHDFEVNESVALRELKVPTALKKNGIIRDWMDIEWDIEWILNGILNGIFQYHGNQPKDPWIWMVLIPADPQHESQGCCYAPAVRKLNCLIWLAEAFSGTLWHWAGIYAESTRKWGGTGQNWKLFGCDMVWPCSLRCTRRFEIRCSQFSSKHALPRTPMSA